MKKQDAKKVRVTLDLSSQFNERLESLESLVEASSKADVIRQALQLYEYVARRTVNGYTFRSVDANGQQENLVFFGAMSAAPIVERTSAEKKGKVYDDALSRAL